MDDPNTTTGLLVEADEDILTSAVSDEVIEAAATAAGVEPTHGVSYFAGCCSVNFCR
jgi:hypothetical protein